MKSQPPTRRAALTGLGAGLIAAPAFASPKAAGPNADVASHPGFSAWETPPAGKGDLPLSSEVTLEGGGRTPLKSWLGGRPAVLVVWASWCGPCMADKPFQADMDRRLKAAGSQARILSVQSFDRDADPGLVAYRLKRLGVQNLANAVASPDLERDLVKWFGPSRSDPRRTFTPCLALIGGDGATLGRCIGRPFTPQDQEWWPEPAAFALLNALA